MDMATIRRRTDILVEDLHRTSAARETARAALHAAQDCGDLEGVRSALQALADRCEAAALRAITAIGSSR